MDPARLRRFLSAALLALGLAGCRGERASLVLAATTSTYDAGILEVLVRAYEDDRPGLSLRTVVTGSGEALELGRRGDADALLVHAPEAELGFIEAGHARERVPIMYNGFVLVGPPDDPAGVARLDDPAAALGRIRAMRAPFVSRGDSSGTHAREIVLWGSPPRDREGWYLESGQGQANSLHLASERAAYTLTDEATFRVLEPILDLEIMVEGHETLLNLYSALRPEAALRAREADDFIEWLSSQRGRRIIGAFRGGDPPRRLFVPFSLGDRLPIPGAHELEAESDFVPPS